ncbi:maleylpyruvate isomerase N-terminal domain-containing protein [Actinoplanes sp. URMC 104]|uniref:maleylpyruvate isomerase N-terminal domain-containing protein n=1 Tax=Actinoplanes sp. URMC 104 TaxID=3423409 RepID=UPI003F1C0A19
MNSDDVTHAVHLAAATLTAATDRDWEAPAGDLTWTCWETVEHVADDLFTYAAQLSLTEPSLTTNVPYGWQHRREGGPGLTVFVDRADGPDGLLRVLESSGGLLAAMVAVAPPERMSFHSYGASDPSGFAAMGVVEVLVHMHDLAAGLKLDWTPPADLCARALARLFPDAPGDTDPWTALLWCTGRLELPGRPRLTTWKWDGSPR